jgi:hypothetical protein
VSLRNPILDYHPGIGPNEEPCDIYCLTCRGGTNYGSHRWVPQELTEEQLDLYVRTGATVWLKLRPAEPKSYVEEEA